MIYVFLAIGKEMNNGLEKFSSSEAKKSSKPITAKARSSAERVTVVALRLQSGKVSEERVMKEFHQKQRDEFRLQRKETAWRCCVVFGNTWSSVEDGNKREGAVQREICRAGSQNRKTHQYNSLPLRQVWLVYHLGKK